MEKSFARNVRGLCGLFIGVMVMSGFRVSAQVAPLAPRWPAGTPPPPVETFAAGLDRHHIEPSHTALVSALQDSDGEVRSLAAAQLAAMDDHPALPAIIRALEDERDPQVQVNIAGAATWLGSRRALDELQRICQNVNVPATARLDAARYVSHKEQPTCYSAIEQIERTDQDPANRVLALQAAANYRGKANEAQLLAVAALADLYPEVRITAADILRALHATHAVPALSDALQKDVDETAREHIREAIRVLRLPRPKDE